MWVRHIIVRVRVRVSTESPLPKHKKEKKEIVAVTDRLWNYLGRSFSIAYGNESGMLRRAHRPSKRKSPGVCEPIWPSDSRKRKTLHGA